MATHFHFNLNDSKASHCMYSFQTIVIIQKSLLYQPRATQTMIGLQLSTQFLSSLPESRQLRRQIYQANGHNRIQFIRDQFTKRQGFTPNQFSQTMVSKLFKHPKKSTFFLRVQSKLYKCYRSGVAKK